MAVKFRDYYEVLGVPRSASDADIQRAYRKLARQHHPDLKPAAERAAAADRFKEINEAYEVLRDPEKRRKYDALGENWRGGQEFTPPPGYGPGAGGGPTVEWGDAGDLGDFSDFFESLFGRAARGGAWSGRAGHTRAPERGRDVEAEMPIALEESLNGGRRRLTLEGGRTLEVDIPRGARDGTVLRLQGQGSAGPAGKPAGDLYLHLRLAPHPRFHVEEDDLDMDLPLAPWQAVLGSDVRVETLDGPVSLKVPPGTQSGGRLRLRGRGLPRPDGSRGDLYATARIVVPERPTAAEREAYETLRRAAGAETAKGG